MPEQPAPHEVPSFVQLQSTALDIVCRCLLGESDSNGTPYWKPRENIPPAPPPFVSELIDDVEYWLKEHEHIVNQDHLHRLKEALEIAMADRVAYKKAKRARGSI